MSTSYDEIPYMGRVHSQTHPERLAVIAQLFGLEHPPLDGCRVLELGCGDGSNLLNMAYHMPEAHFVGIDSAETHIERGHQLAETAGIQNYDLRTMDIMDFGPEMGDFDYILCHGVFSWVPEPVRDKILDICRTQLTEKGIAYISYNALPGWHMYGMLRDMMRYHAFKMDGTQDRIDQARAVVQFVSECVLDPFTPYGNFLQNNVEFISRLTGEYLFHEYLEAENTPFYFHEFVDLAAKNNLQYLGDTEFHTMTNLNYSESTKELLDSISPSIFELEQYMDFLRCRRFRCTLLVHDSNTVSREVTLDPFMTLRYAFRAFPKADATEKMDPATDEPPQELESTLQAITISIPDVEGPSSAADFGHYRTVLEHLHEIWPKTAHFEDLCQKCSEVSGKKLEAQDKMDLALLFQSLFLKNLVELHLLEPRLVTEVSERPEVSPIARHQLSYQSVINSQRHDMVVVQDEWVKEMAKRLDGSKTIAEVQEELIGMLHAGELPEPVETQDDEAPIRGEELKAVLAERIQKALSHLAENGVLVA
jgi:SAM-dependent methyltransferase